MATLKVTIHEARDLPVMDRATGLADPYVIVSLNTESYTTEIDTGTCNPIWNKDCRFDAANLLTLQEDPVEFRVFDHDIVTRDDLIGMLYIDLNCILGREIPTLSGWFPLFDTMAGLRGELRVTLKVKFHAAENPTAPRVPSRSVRHMGSQAAVSSALRRFANSTLAAILSGASHVVGGAALSEEHRGSDISPMSPAAVSPALQYQVDTTELRPIGYLRPNQPSLTTEEEGIHIFSMSRLDPSVFRIESLLPMVEELIVKADPEHSKFTTLRSSRATNEARMLQLFKLSGKVRRQLTRKVLELQCNCVLGYEERYDLEPNGIIVRAYGTPCVVSSVKFTVHTDSSTGCTSMPLMASLPPAAVGSGHVPSHGAVQVGAGMSMTVTGSDMMGGFHPSFSPQASSLTGMAASTSKPGSEDVLNHPMQSPQPTGDIFLYASGDGTSENPTHSSALAHEDMDSKVLRASTHLQSHTGGVGGPLTVPATPAHQHQRAPVITLTVSDMPSGMLYHVGGLVSARSVKLVSKLKNKLSISQERDAWWSELREEVKYNARSLHCNAIIGYEEVAMYDHEDVVVLSISGTAVVLDTTWLAMRCGPENLYHRLAHRLMTGKSCAILHLYQGHHQSPHHHHANHHSHARHHHGGTRRDDGTVSGFLCTMCRKKSVPEVILASCAVPLDIAVDGPPVLIQAVVSKMKPNVKGAELALCLSQALPFLEFSLHKQLIFKMQLERMNAAFGLKVEFAVGSDVIVATLTATAFRVAGLPVPQAPKLEFWEVDRLPQAAVSKLQNAVERAKHTTSHRPRRRPTALGAMLSLQSSLKRRNTTAISASDLQKSPRAPPQDGSGAAAEGADGDHGESVTSGDGGDSDMSSFDDGATHDTWISSSSSSASDDAEGGTSFAHPSGSPKKHSDVTEYTILIDDEEEAELMVGMISSETSDEAIRLDDLVVTVPYLPTEPNRYCGSQERITLSRRYSVQNVPSVVVATAAGGAAGGSVGAQKLEMNTSFLNQCFTNARVTFLMHLRRIALRCRCASMYDLRVFNFHVHCVFEPNTNDLHMVLDGLVCVAHGERDDAERKMLGVMQNRAFDESETLLFTSGLPHRRQSPLILARGTGDDAPEAGDDVALGGSFGETSMLAAGSAPVGDLSNTSFQKWWRQYRKSRRGVFARSNAPFNLPFAFRRELTSSSAVLPHDPFSLLEGRSSGGVLSDMRAGDRTGMSEQSKRTGVVRRQLHALTSLASATLRNFADRVGIGSEVLPQQTGGTANSDNGSVGNQSGLTKSQSNDNNSSSLNFTATAKGGTHQSSLGGGSGAGQHKSALQQLLQPCSRVPSDRRALLNYDDPFFITPLSYVAGHAVVRYISRISQHFIREAYEVYSAEELGGFYMQTDLEMHGVVRALVKSLGGNTLLCHTVQLHEVWDSDGSGCAFLCVTVTGHVALVTKENVLDDDMMSYAS